jgi:hypothetical protein
VQSASDTLIGLGAQRFNTLGPPKIPVRCSRVAQRRPGDGARIAVRAFGIALVAAAAGGFERLSNCRSRLRRCSCGGVVFFLVGLNLVLDARAGIRRRRRLLSRRRWRL